MTTHEKNFYNLQKEIVVKTRGRNKTVIKKNDNESVRDNYMKRPIKTKATENLIIVKVKIKIKMKNISILI